MAPDLISFIRDGNPTDETDRFLSTESIENYGIFDSKMVNRLLNKYKRRGLKDIGYRDNMLISFILSGQIIEYWIRNPKQTKLDKKKLHIYEIED